MQSPILYNGRNSDGPIEVEGRQEWESVHAPRGIRMDGITMFIFGSNPFSEDMASVQPFNDIVLAGAINRKA